MKTARSGRADVLPAPAVWAGGRNTASPGKAVEGRTVLVGTAATLLLGIGLRLLLPACSNSGAALLAGALWVACVSQSLRLCRLDPLSPALIYLYLLGLFHLGLVVPWALGWQTASPPAWLITSDLRPALGLVVVALTAYQTGALAAVLFWPPRLADASRPVRRCHNRVLCQAGFAVVALGLLAFCGGVQSLGLERLLRADYAETYALATRYDPRLFATSLTLVPLGLYLAAAAAPWRSLWWIIGLGAAWGGGILFLGFRGYALVPAITIFAVLHKRGLRLSRFAYFAALVLVLCAIPLVRAIRGDRLAQRVVGGSLSLDAPLEALAEMGGSLRPLVHTVQFLQNERLRLGGTYWQALKSAAPNFAFTWQGGEYLPLEQLPPSHWLTLQAAPHTYQAHGGLGFSAVAEPYMNFGAPGVAGYFFFLALVLTAAYRFDVTLPSRLALWAVVLGPLLWTVRNDFHGFFRPVILGMAVIAACRLVSSSLAGTRAHAASYPGRLRPAGREAFPPSGGCAVPTKGEALRG